MRIIVTVDSDGGGQDLLLDCDDATSLVDVAAAIGQESAVQVRFPIRDESSQGSMVGSGLYHGTRVTPSGLTSEDDLPSEGLQLHITGGLAAGSVFALTLGTHEIGRSGTLSWGDHSLSRRHCRITVTADSITVTDLESTNGTFLEGERLPAGEETAWELGSQLEIGDSTAIVRPARLHETVVEDADPGWRSFLRPPRIMPFWEEPSVEVPRAPGKQTKRSFPVIAMVVPLVFGIAMALIMNPMFLMFSLMSPVMMAANYFSDKRGTGKSRAEEMAEYEESLSKAQEALTNYTKSEQNRLRDALPDAGETFVTALLPGKRLWERRRFDDDFLMVRVGAADQPSTIKITGEVPETLPKLHAVPIGASLPEAGVVGLAGPDDVIDGLLRWVMIQIASYQAPRDLTMSFLTSRGSEDWSWAAWLPQLASGDLDSCVAMVGNDSETLSSQVAWLNTVIKDRQDLARESRAEADSFPAHVVVLHGYRGLRQVPGLATILDDGPAVGVYALCVDEHERALPDSCKSTLQIDLADKTRGVLRRSGHPDANSVLVDSVSPAWADRAARSIASLRDVGGADDAGMLPDSARLLDVLSVDPPTPEKIRSGWIMSPSSTKMTLGVGVDGPFSLDLKADGPHGLIAGMTGSGKTELLQTMIASLAIANRPDAINFVLVDYKGDSAFKDCVKLPHTVGKVNDLDPHLVVRALESLKAELKYREHFLAEAQVKDIEDYQELQLKEPHRPPLPRLLLVIDEFAQLSKDLPDFVTGLVSIAQLGRSLGIHLLLATQRPSGVVSPEIRANTNMRLALRVADSGDSTDVLDVPDAANISKSTPGRAYARLGAGALQAFQSGRVGGRRPGAVAVDLPPPFVAKLGWRNLGYAAPRPPARKETEVEGTDLSELVSAVSKASAQEGVPEQRSPWLPAIPEVVSWSDEVTAQAQRGLVPVLAYGRRDLPQQQAQMTVGLDLMRDGHMLVVGSPGSGRSQILRTLAASAAGTAHPSDIHLYGIDCGNGALNALNALPHTGAIVSRTETPRATRLLARLGEELDRRQQMLAASGYGDIAEQRSGSTEPLPHLVLLIDRWEGFAVTLGEVDANLDLVMRLLREGASAGIHVVITGDRSLAYNTRISSLVENKLTLRLADRDDYSLLGLRPKDMPDQMPPGRAFATGGAETQVFVLGEDLSSQGQASALAALGTHAEEQFGADYLHPFRVDALPSHLKLDQALDLLPAGGAVSPVVGVGGDELTAFTIDLTRGNGFVVAGPGRSGRSTVLSGIAASTIATGGAVIAFAPRPSPLRELTGEGVLAVVTDPTTTEEQFDAWVQDVGRPVVVIIDDGEGLRDAAAGNFLLRVARGQIPGVFIVLGGHPDGLGTGFSGWQPEVVKGRQGLLLSPQGLSDGDVVGTRIPRDVINPQVVPGRGWLHLGDGNLIQVATVAP